VISQESVEKRIREFEAKNTKLHEVNEQLEHLLCMVAVLLRRCYLYRGYDHGPAREPAVRKILEQVDDFTNGRYNAYVAKDKDTMRKLNTIF